MEKIERKVEYVKLSQQGRRKCTQMHKQTHRIMTFWMIVGLIGGGVTMKVLPMIFKNNHYVQKRSIVSFFLISGTLTYHGYKLMEFQRRKAMRILAKNPQNLDPEQPNPYVTIPKIQNNQKKESDNQ